MDDFDRPGPLLLASEYPRAATELGAFAATVAPLLARAPHGDGHRVLVLPGFMADDTSTRPLRWFLRRLEYRTYSWRLGLNLGPTDHVLDGLVNRLARVASDADPISLVGWSLGGIYARELAFLFPDRVRQVITLGSPFRIGDSEQSNASPLYDLLSTFHSDRAETDRPPGEQRGPLPVPSTAIYTRCDGIVAWESTMEPDGPQRESIRVRGSHCGLGHNPAVLRIIAERLAQPQGSWARYRTGQGTAA
ncbi:MAG: esterase/lipase family protein [Acidimicrobiales bacterium]